MKETEEEWQSRAVMMEDGPEKHYVGALEGGGRGYKQRNVGSL